MDPQLGYGYYLLFLGVLILGALRGCLQAYKDENKRRNNKNTSAYWGHGWQRNFLDDIIH